MRWLRQLFERRKQIPETEVVGAVVAAFAAEQQRIKSAGAVVGAHYTDFVEQVRVLKRQKRHAEAIDLPSPLVDGTEADSLSAGVRWGVGPWYYTTHRLTHRNTPPHQQAVTIFQR